MTKLETLFAENFTTYGELGASFSLYQGGTQLVSLAGGWCDCQQTQRWTADTAVLVWSATKGPAAACVLHAMQQAGIELSTRVADVWPEFGQAGKSNVTFAQALSHQAGLAALDTVVSVSDHASVAAAIAAQLPIWPPGSAHGYAPRVHGFLLDELVRRITGIPLGSYWAEQFAKPLSLEFWIGLPADVSAPIASVFSAKAALPAGDPFYAAFADRTTLTARAFASPQGLHGVASMNEPSARALSLPGFGGIGTARALAKFYSILAGDGTFAGRVFFQPRTLSWMREPLVTGEDRVLLRETAFSAGFMLDPCDAQGNKVRCIYGSTHSAFGHPGAGGSLAFAVPERGIGVAYVMNQMEHGTLPGPKALRLIDALLI